jgi:hypothetical protein
MKNVELCTDHVIPENEILSVIIDDDDLSDNSWIKIWHKDGRMTHVQMSRNSLLLNSNTGRYKEEKKKKKSKEICNVMVTFLLIGMCIGILINQFAREKTKEVSTPNTVLNQKPELVDPKYIVNDYNRDELSTTNQNFLWCFMDSNKLDKKEIVKLLRNIP